MCTRETCCTESWRRFTGRCRWSGSISTQCAVGRQAGVIEHTLFACDRLSLVISPKSTIFCSDVKTETLLRRGLLELGINFGVSRRTRDSGGGSRRAVGLMRKRLCKAAKRSKRLAVIRRHTKKASSLHSTSIWYAPASELWEWALRHPPCKASNRAPRMPCAPSRVTSGIAIGLPSDPTVQAGIVRQAVAGVQAQFILVCPHARARAWMEALPRAASRQELPLVEDSGPMRAVMCVLFDAGWFPLHPTNWKQAGGEGVFWSFTGVGDSAELIQVLSRDIRSVHRARAATHWNGAGFENGCDVSTVKQHLCFFPRNENHAMCTAHGSYGRLLAEGSRRGASARRVG